MHSISITIPRLMILISGVTFTLSLNVVYGQSADMVNSNGITHEIIQRSGGSANKLFTSLDKVEKSPWCLFTAAILAGNAAPDQADQAVLSVWFDPNPVSSYTGPDPITSALKEWHFTAYVKETAGLGVTTNKVTWNFYDQNGKFTYQQEDSKTDFARRFDDCGPGSVYIGRRSTACAKLYATDYHAIPYGSVIMTFYGTDDKGNEMRKAARLNFLP